MRPVFLADPPPRLPLRPSRPQPGRPRLRRLAALLGIAAAALTAACDREVALTGEDPLEVEVANAGVDALLLEGETARRVARHQLTAARVERWFAAQEALDAQSADDPSLGAYTPRLGGTGGDAIERAVAALEERPGAEAAIRDAGLSVEDFVLTGLALHQALTASGPAAPPTLRRLAARNVRFVAEHTDLLARFRTQRPMYVAEADPVDTLGWADTLGWYDPFADTVQYGAAAAPPPDSIPPDTTAPPVDSVRVPPADTLRRPPPPLIPVQPRVAPPPAAPPPAGPPPTSPPVGATASHSR